MNVDSPPPSFIDVTLPSAAAVGDGWAASIKKIGSSIDVRVSTTGGQTIDGDTSRVIKQKNKAFRVVSDGSQWCVMYPTPSTGWAYYRDSSTSPISLTAGERVQLVIDGLHADTNQDHLPDGVTHFWDSTDSSITGQKTGDTYDIRISFDAVTTQVTESIKVELDIGDPNVTPEEIIEDAHETIQFAEPDTHFAVASFPIFTLGRSLLMPRI